MSEGGQQAERDAQHDDGHRGIGADTQRVREARCDDLVGGEAALLVRGAEVALSIVGQTRQVLLPKRLVEAVLLVHGRAQLRVGHLLGVERVAGNGVHEKERRRHDKPYGDERSKHAFNDVLSHGVLPNPRRTRPPRAPKAGQPVVRAALLAEQSPTGRPTRRSRRP